MIFHSYTQASRLSNMCRRTSLSYQGEDKLPFWSMHSCWGSNLKHRQLRDLLSAVGLDTLHSVNLTSMTKQPDAHQKHHLMRACNPYTGTTLFGKVRIQPQACVACDRPFTAQGGTATSHNSNNNNNHHGNNNENYGFDGNRAAARPIGSQALPGDDAYR